MLARILLSIAAFQYSVIPIFVDLSRSHVFNEHWPPHSRFHMVWLLALGALSAVFAMWLTWAYGRGSKERMKLACIPGFLVRGSFFVSFFRSDFTAVR